MRHGEPEVYAAPDASLSENGKNQVREFARKLAEDLTTRQEKGAFIKILYSGVTRTKESGEILEVELERVINEKQLQNVRLLNSHERKTLQTTETLGPVIQSGIPKETAYDKWLEASPEELQLLGAKTPEEVGEAMEEFIDRMNRLSTRLGKGPEIDYVWVTHETTHGAILKRLNPDEPPTKIDFAEPLEIDIGQKDGSIKYKFRDREFSETPSEK